MPAKNSGYHFVKFLQSRPEWMERAACRGVGFDKGFFPVEGQTASKVITLYCANCPVQRECSEFAKSTHTHHGVWGGHILGRHAR